MAELNTVLGANGLVGRKLVSELKKRKKLVWCPSRDEEKQLFQRELGTIYYCAGLTADYSNRPYDTIEAHVSLLSRLLASAQFDRLVYLSSTRLYDSLGEVIATEELDLKVNPLNPRHLYDISKALGENLCLCASKNRACVVRLACVVGNELVDDGFIPMLINEAIGKTVIEVESSPNFERDYIGLDDTVRLILIIAEQGNRSIYNIASGRNTKNSDIAGIISEFTGCEIVFKHQKSLSLPQIDISRVKDEFDIEPTLIKDLIESLIDNKRPDFDNKRF